MSVQHRVLLEPLGLTIEVESGHTILYAVAKSGFPIATDCGGMGTCYKCQVSARPASNLSPRTDVEKQVFYQNPSSDHRLACQVKVFGPATITLDHWGEGEVVNRGKTKVSGAYQLDPAVKLINSRLDSGGKSVNEQPRDLVAMHSHHSGHNLKVRDPAVLRGLSMQQAGDAGITLVEHNQHGVTAILPACRKRSLGLAVDVGTTTVATYLCDLLTGEIKASAAIANPQRRYGEDVISRISHANRNPAELKILQSIIIDTLNELLSRCLTKVHAEMEDVHELVIVGNPTMQHLLCGLHPHSLGISPNLPVITRSLELRAADLEGLNILPGINVHIFPVISGFLGGDTLAAMIATDIHQRDEVCLLVDLGTNGEIVLGNRDGLWATSCATGPAFEGAHIACGVRAVPGAIHQANFVLPDRRIELHTIPTASGRKVKPVGICGSGLIDLLAAMRHAGMILPSGVFNSANDIMDVEEVDGARQFTFVPAQDSGSGVPIVIKLADVRQVQLAKAAIFMGIEKLIEHSGIEHIDRVILTGAFGARFNWLNAVTIGLLPDYLVNAKVETVENAAGVGGIKVLLDHKQRETAMALSQSVRVVGLSRESDFQVRFAQATLFPSLRSD